MKMKIENGNYVRSNDGQRRIDSSGLQAERFVVPATIAAIYITHGKLGRKYSPRKQINLLQNRFQSK